MASIIDCTVAQSTVNVIKMTFEMKVTNAAMKTVLFCMAFLVP